MTRYEYRVVPAPARGVKAKGAKTTEARFAHALMELMNGLGAEGWEYQRTDTLPCEERVGLTGRTMRFQNMLVFRRALDAAKAEAPAETAPVAEFRRLPPPEEEADNEDDAAADAADDDAAASAESPETEADDERPAALSVAKRLAATLSAKPPEGPSPAVRRGLSSGPAPKIGGADGNGIEQPGGSGVAAE